MSQSADEFVFVPLGGVGEIGMNLYLYGYGVASSRRWVIVDIGVTFAGDNLPGIDVVFPDIDYALSTGTIDAIILTHAHEDHYGGLLSLWERIEAPIFCTSFTAGMLESKRLYNGSFVDLPIHIFSAGDTFDAGPFSVEAIHVCHSVPESVSLLLRSPLGNVLHTGDWKLDKRPVLGEPIDISHFERLGDEGILALVCDSTNAMRDGESAGEGDVSDSLKSFMSSSDGRVVISTFSSHVGRIRSVCLAARECGRKVMLMGAAFHRVSGVARDLGYFDDLPPFLSSSDFSTTPRDKLVILCTGSQGESRAALNRLSHDSHPHAHLNAGDMVIFSSRPIPGNERSVIDIQNRFVSRGIEIILDGEHGLTHVSGHPRRDELRQMYSWTRPHIGIPVHGEARHLSSHASLMSSCGIPDVCPIFNGELVRLAPGKAEVFDSVSVGQVYQDGTLLVSPCESGVSTRQELGHSGHISIHLVLSPHGDLLCPMEMLSRGLPTSPCESSDTLDDALYAEALSAFHSIPPDTRTDKSRVERAVRRAVRSHSKRLWSKRPITDVFVTFVEGS